MTPLAAAIVLLLQATPPPADLPLEQTKKNIKVLQGVPSSQLIPTMAFMANSLGVTCAYCHNPKEYESDEKPAKEATRRMIALQRSINQQHFAGKLVVTCNTCHQGHVETPAIPNVASSGWNHTPEPSIATIAGEAVVERLPEPKQGVTKRIVRGTVERDNGRDEPKSAPFTVTFSGNEISYDTELSHPPEARRAFALYLLQRPKPEQLRGERWTIAPDKITRHRELATPLGTLPEEYEWDDFRDGLPYRARWMRADYRVTYAITSIESEPVAEAAPAQKRGNIQLLHAIPESQIFLAMNAIAGSLGVHCDHCHVKNGETWMWASDEKPQKKIARDMMKMTLALNDSHGMNVTCYSCHRGALTVDRVIPLPPNDPTITKAARTLPTPAEIIARYRAALGGAGSKSATLAGRIDSKARSGEFQMDYQPNQVAEDVAQMKTTGIERIDGRDAVSVVVKNDDRSITYFFDLESALLLRKLTLVETMIGPLPEQVDFSDYRNGIPFVIRTSDAAPWDTTVRTFTRVE